VYVESGRAKGKVVVEINKNLGLTDMND
jgi:hypothetical protein